MRIVLVSILTFIVSYVLFSVLGVYTGFIATSDIVVIMFSISILLLSLSLTDTLYVVEKYVETFGIRFNERLKSDILQMYSIMMILSIITAIYVVVSRILVKPITIIVVVVSNIILLHALLSYTFIHVVNVLVRKIGEEKQ